MCGCALDLESLSHRHVKAKPSLRSVAFQGVFCHAERKVRDPVSCWSRPARKSGSLCPSGSHKLIWRSVMTATENPVLQAPSGEPSAFDSIVHLGFDTFAASTRAPAVKGDATLINGSESCSYTLCETSEVLR